VIVFLGAADRWVLRIEKMDKDGWTKNECGIQQVDSPLAMAAEYRPHHQPVLNVPARLVAREIQ
jgi:hypothetical protein